MKYVVCSDIHLGHLNTPTEHICNSFRKFILTDANKDSDVIFIAGDVFDRLLDSNSLELALIVGLFNDIFNYCYSNDILLRVLEGTPSHDYGQFSLLWKVNEIRKNKCDLVYHKVLDIEYISRIGKHVLYIPDEWCHDHDELEKQIELKMQEKGVDKVDIAILHGQFAYQFAGKPYTGFHYKEAYFLEKVVGFIHLGHYHNYTSLDRIIANGSLERLVHGDEIPKGYVVINDKSFTFIENTDAWSYVSLNVNTNTSLESLDKKIYRLRKGSFVRLVMKPGHPFIDMFKDLKLRYIDHNLKRLVKDGSVVESIGSLLNDTDIDVSQGYIVQSDIYGLLIRIMDEKYSFNEREKVILDEYMTLFRVDKPSGII